MLNYLVIILLLLFALYIGIILGIKDCKRRFGIPKGVRSEEEWMDLLFKESDYF